MAFEDASREERVSRFVRERLARTIHTAHDALMAETSVRGMDFRAIESAITEVVRFLKENPVTWALFASGEGEEESGVAQHAGNVFYLAMILGNGVRGQLREADRAMRLPKGHPRPNVDLAALGLAALLMDISLWPCHAQLAHPGPLTDEERELVYQHAARSADMLPAATDVQTILAVRDHHENHNGTGYPRRLAGSEIPLFARILRVADAYTAAISSRTYRANKSTVRAFWEMTCGPYMEYYDPVIRKLFQSIVQPYPIGAKVRLSCGRYAVVVRYGQIHGLLPEVVIAFDEDGQRLPSHLVAGPYRLDQRPDLRIVSFRDEDLSNIYGDEPVEADISPLAPSDFQEFAESCFP